jgi:hypothetical protein
LVPCGPGFRGGLSALPPPCGLSVASALPARASESLFQLPTLLGFALQSLTPAAWPSRGFPRPIRSCVSLPNAPAWHSRFSGLRSPDQPRILPPGTRWGPGGAVALLSFGVSRVFLRRNWEESPSFFLPLSPFPSLPPKKPRTGAPGDPFRRLGISLLSKGADPFDVPDRRPLLPLKNAGRLRPIFSVPNPPVLHRPGGIRLSSRPRLA